MSKPRVKVPKKAKAGDIVQIKTLMRHKMETGLRKDKKTGKKIPQQIIKRFTATFNGREVFSTDLFASVSANPYLAFYFKADASGEFEFTWIEDTGKTWTTKKKLMVA
jgi:sulfur-oxidizing protein SoxZ